MSVSGADTCTRWSAASCDAYESAVASCTAPSCALSYAAAVTPLLMQTSPSSGGVDTLLTLHASGLSATASLNTVLIGGKDCLVQSMTTASGAPWGGEARQPVRELVCRVPASEAGEHAVRVGLSGGSGLDIARQAFSFVHELKVLDDSKAPTSHDFPLGFR